jgi:hypothetical protein
MLHEIIAICGPVGSLSSDPAVAHMKCSVLFEACYELESYELKSKPDFKIRAENSSKLKNPSLSISNSSMVTLAS